MGPIRHGLLAKSSEAALTAVQTYNNPLVKFKSESYIVLMTIAWTYLLHAYYSRKQVDYRYLNRDPAVRGKYQRTRHGGYRLWDLSACLSANECPLDRATVLNLQFLVGLRDEIIHHRPPHLDDHMSGRNVACALNYEYWLIKLFGARYSLGETLSMPIHFQDTRPIDTKGVAKLPGGITRDIERFEASMTQAEFDDPRFAYRVLFTRRTANHKGQADRAIEFVKSGDPGAETVEPERWVIKDTEKPKFRRDAVIGAAHAAGFTWFGPYQHTQLWRRLDAKDPSRGFGITVAGEWFWYQTWIDEVLTQCRDNADSFPVAIHRAREPLSIPS